MGCYYIEDIDKWANEVRAGDELRLSGVIYTARDAAHKKLFELLDAGLPLPIELDKTVFYYAGPTEARPGTVIGSCGPTTSSRMDKFTPRLLELGLRGVIGKGERSITVKEAFAENSRLYMCALGGAGAIASAAIKKCDVIAFPELGCESIKRLEVENMPVFCAYDLHGGDIFSRSVK
ncbi:MAG: FumA C-terminus/TtdB family hydratase beta subunit [Firmicutes bacterium]|nr:FumA C-terminus/TtdB family hydratase beta subunit [Bacillota bacterium]